MIKSQKSCRFFYLLLPLLIYFSFSIFFISPDLCLRRVRFLEPQAQVIGKVKQLLQGILSEEGQKKSYALQYGLTLGSKKLRNQVAKILAGVGIKADPENNIGIFHNLSEVFIILGEVFIDSGDVVYYQSPEDLVILQPLTYYGAVLKPLNKHGLHKLDSEVKLLYISDSSALSFEERKELLDLAVEKKFLIIEKNNGSQKSLKIDDKEGWVIYLGVFSDISLLDGIPDISLVYLEAPSPFLAKIEIAKGALTLCTNSLVQSELIELLAPFLDNKEVEFEEDIPNLTSSDIRELFSSRGKRLRPSEIREILKYASRKGLVYLAGGVPDPRLFPYEAVIKILSDLTLEEWREIFNGFMDHLGSPRLRAAMASYVSKQEGINVGRDNVFIVNGSQQALDLIARFAERQGRVIIAESPTYLGMINAALPHIGSENFIHIDLRTPQGLSKLNRYLNSLLTDNQSAPIIYLTPNFGNPSGYLWTVEERRALIELVREFRERGYDVLIIEDDPYGELNYTLPQRGEEIKVPSFLSLYPEAVIYLATNSKIFAPGTRIGYIIGDNEYMAEFANLMQELRVEVSVLTQLITARFISSGMLERHIQTLRREYAKKAIAMDEALRKYMPPEVIWEKPLGGMFVWVRIPQEWGIDLRKLLHEVAVEHGAEVDGEIVKVAYVPGGAFSVDDSTSNALRLCFTTATIDEIHKGIQALAILLQQSRKEGNYQM